MLQSTKPLFQHRETQTTHVNRSKVVSQSAFTCSKLTIETLEQGVKYVQS